MAIINERIKERRHELGLTLLEVAEAIGVREATAQRYESGAIKNISHEVICKLSETLRCSPSYLMGWEAAPAASSAADTSPAPDSLRAQLLSDYDRLNDEGRQRVVDYADDLVISGRYEKNILDKVL